MMRQSLHARPNYLAEVTTTLLYIRDTQASGRLSIRNHERFGLAHLYFSTARLIHVTGDKRDAGAVLNDLLTWTKASLRFDQAITVGYETVNWQHAHIFARWLAFLELRAAMQDVPPARLAGLVQGLTAALPQQPIALPATIERYEEYEEDPLVRQWQRLSEGVSHVNSMLGRTLTEDQREQLRQFSHSVHGAVQQARDATQELTKRAAKATQEAVRQVSQSAEEAFKQSRSMRPPSLREIAAAKGNDE